MPEAQWEPDALRSPEGKFHPAILGQNGQHIVHQDGVEDRGEAERLSYEAVVQQGSVDDKGEPVDFLRDPKWVQCQNAPDWERIKNQGDLPADGVKDPARVNAPQMDSNPQVARDPLADAADVEGEGPEADAARKRQEAARKQEQERAERQKAEASGDTAKSDDSVKGEGGQKGGQMAGPGRPLSGSGLTTDSNPRPRSEMDRPVPTKNRG